MHMEERSRAHTRMLTSGGAAKKRFVPEGYRPTSPDLTRDSTPLNVAEDGPPGPRSQMSESHLPLGWLAISPAADKRR